MNHTEHREHRDENKVFSVVNPCQCQPGKPPCAFCQSRGAGQTPLPTTSERSLPCIYLGNVLDRQGQMCPARWLRQCDLHQLCTLQDCKNCPDYQEG